MDDVKDSNGNILKDGDSVHVIKDLKVKGAGETLKRGTLIKNIRLTDNPGEIEGRTGTIKGLVLKTEFVKKAGGRKRPSSASRHLLPSSTGEGARAGTYELVTLSGSFDPSRLLPSPGLIRGWEKVPTGG